MKIHRGLFQETGVLLYGNDGKFAQNETKGYNRRLHFGYFSFSY